MPMVIPTKNANKLPEFFLEDYFFLYFYSLDITFSGELHPVVITRLL